MLQLYVVEFGQFAGEVAPRLSLEPPKEAPPDEGKGGVLFLHDKDGQGKFIKDFLETRANAPILVIWICEDVVPTPQPWFMRVRGLQIWAPSKLYTGLAVEWRILDGRPVENAPGAAIWYDAPEYNLADFFEEVRRRGQRVIPQGDRHGHR